MTKRRDETHEEYLARGRVYRSARRATMPEHERAVRARSDAKRYAAVMADPDARKKWLVGQRRAAAKYRKKVGRETIRQKYSDDRERKIEQLWGRRRPAHCEICGATQTKPLVNDHDHSTKQPRLFLCFTCNTIEGFIKPHWKRISALVAYHAWVEGFRGQLQLPITIRDSYPTSPEISEKDKDWVIRYIEGKRICATKESSGRRKWAL